MGRISSSPFDLSNIYFITHPHLYMGELEARCRRETEKLDSPVIIFTVNYGG